MIGAIPVFDVVVGDGTFQASLESGKISGTCRYEPNSQWTGGILHGQVHNGPDGLIKEQIEIEFRGFEGTLKLKR